MYLIYSRSKNEDFALGAKPFDGLTDGQKDGLTGTIKIYLTFLSSSKSADITIVTCSFKMFHCVMKMSCIVLHNAQCIWTIYKQAFVKKTVLIGDIT